MKFPISDLTFGKCPAAVSLARMINETNDLKSLRKVGRTLVNFNRLLKELSNLTFQTRMHVAKLAFTDLQSKQYKGLPSKIDSYLRNCIHASYKQWFHENQGIIPNKNRIK